MTRDEAIAQLTAPGAPFEIVPVTQYGHECRMVAATPNSLRELFDAARSSETFLVYEDERLTFEQTWQEAARIAHLLVHEYGVGKGDRVAISMRNYPEWVTTFMAATSVGAIAVAMNALWTPDEIAYALGDSAPKVLVIDDERAARVAQIDPAPEDVAVLVVRGQSAFTDLGVALRSVPADVAMPTADIDPTDDAIIFYTSGSTGHPKGAVSCHRAVLSALMSWELDLNAKVLAENLEVPEPAYQAATLLAVPLFHATGSHAVFLMSYRAQRKIVCMYKWDVALAADLIEREQVSSVVAPAAMTGDLVNFAREHGRGLETLASVGGGGAPRASEQVANIERTFANALPSTGWGMTETNAIGTTISGEDYLAHPESSGRCSALLDLRIVDEDGFAVATGERGELQIRGVSIIRGYWNRPDANAETFIDGWLRTGDVACFDDEGYLYIVDRIKDLVIRGGENIGCGAVESAIWEHPAVAEVSVYGVPDDRLGEEVGATVYVTGDVAEEELREFLSSRLARFEIPRYFDFVDQPLPRTASGKILKRDLREQAARRIHS